MALAAAKYALLRAIDPGIDDGLEYELDLWARLFGTDDQRQGMAAFLAKQPLARADRTDWAHRSAGFPWATDESRPRKGKGDKGAGPKST